MMAWTVGLLFAALTLMPPLPAADPPEFYRHVDSVDWVVRDLDRVISSWDNLGFGVVDRGEARIVDKRSSGTSESRARIAEGNLAGFRVVWIQPLSGDSPYSRFLGERGEGVFSLNHVVSDRETLVRELGRLGDRGASPTDEVTLAVADYSRDAVVLNTRSDGRMGVCLVLHTHRPALPDSSTSIKFVPSQYAFIVRDLEAPSRYWASLGFPAMEITHGPLSDLRYRGQPGQFDQRLGWQRHGDITYEWIEPLRGPTVYQDAMKSHGEGFHHFAFNVDDMDAAIAFFRHRGYEISQSGSWGSAGKSGSGRFAYVDTDSIGGVTIELLWNYRERQAGSGG